MLPTLPCTGLCFISVLALAAAGGPQDANTPGRRFPQAEIPAFYLDQLAAYVAAIQAIYPKKRVRAALLWTDGPRLMAVSPERLR